MADARRVDRRQTNRMLAQPLHFRPQGLRLGLQLAHTAGNVLRGGRRSRGGPAAWANNVRWDDRNANTAS